MKARTPFYRDGFAIYVGTRHELAHLTRIGGGQGHRAFPLTVGALAAWVLTPLE